MELNENQKKEITLQMVPVMLALIGLAALLIGSVLYAYFQGWI
jgi:hypothetical protein